MTVNNFFLLTCCSIGACCDSRFGTARSLALLYLIVLVSLFEGCHSLSTVFFLFLADEPVCVLFILT